MSLTSLASLAVSAAESSFLQPLKLYHGRVLSSYQTGTYELVTDAGRITAFAHGSTLGVLGVTDSSTYLPGQDVIVAIHEGMSYGVIVCSAGSLSADKDANGLWVDSLSYPRLAGYQYDKRFGGKIRKELLARSPNQRKSGLIDVLDGEWAVSTPFGAAVAVEHFRAILRGAPFAKVECYGEEEPLLKLVGERLEQITLHQEYQDGRLFNTGQQVDRRVFMPYEALNNMPARELHVSGLAHGGSHTFIMPQPNAPVEGEDPRRRFGLFHEFRSYSGEYLLEAASSIVLRKTCTIRTPEEIRPTDAAVLAPDLNTSAEHIAVENEARPSLSAAPSEENSDEPDPHAVLTPFARVLEYIENLSWRGRNAVNRLDKSWTVGQLPDEVAGGDPYYPESRGINFRSESMWHVMPRAFTITLDDKLGAKTFFVGSSSITLAEDGSIVLEDSYHSQIIMSKGNIRISAAKDLILESGRNMLSIAGQDCAVRSYRHLDVASNSGRVHIKAEQQLNLLGGNGGTGGVLIESRSTVAMPTIGEGAQQTSGGIALLSESSVSLAAPQISVCADTKDHSSGSVIINALRNVYVSTSDMVTSFGGELSFAFLPSNTGAVIGSNQTVVHGLVADTVCDLSAGGSSDAMRYIDEQSSMLASSYDSASSTFGVWTWAYDWDQVGFQFCTTSDLGLDDPLTFMLPQTSWQRHLPSSQGAGYGNWSESPVFHKLGGIDPTCPFPGFVAWTADERYVVFPDNEFYRPADGDANDGLDYDPVMASSEVVLPATTVATINANYTRGSSV